MTVANWEYSSDLEDLRSRQFFLRIQNLPTTATPKDVKAFFRGLDILPGGISILGKNAFVSFERLQDMLSAMLKDGRTFYGQKLFLSIVGLKEVQKINDHHIPRTLPFLHQTGGIPKDISEDNSPELLERHRTIRPTAIIRNGSHLEPDSTFSPEEIESPMKDLIANYSTNRVKCIQKRIKPTAVVRVDSFSNTEAMARFNP